MMKRLNQVLIAAIVLVAVWASGLQYAEAQNGTLVNAQVNKFVDEDVRVMAERVRSMKAMLDSMMLRWYHVSDLVPNDSTIIENPARAGEGLTPLTGVDIHNVMYNLTLLQNLLDTPGVQSIIEKPCVRSIEVAR